MKVMVMALHQQATIVPEMPVVVLVRQRPSLGKVGQEMLRESGDEGFDWFAVVETVAEPKIRKANHVLIGSTYFAKQTDQRERCFLGAALIPQVTKRIDIQAQA